MITDSVGIAVILATFGLLFFRQIRVYPLTWSITAATGAIVVIALGAIFPSKTGIWMSTGRNSNGTQRVFLTRLSHRCGVTGS